MEYTYNSEGMLVKRIESLKNAFGGGFLVPISKWEYNYDSDGRMTQSLDSWDRLASGHMYLDTKYEFSYNSNGNEIQNVRYRWNEQTGQWDIRYKTSLYYSDVMDSGLTDIANQLKTFPNPASEFLTFGFNDDSHPVSLELFNMQGEKVIAQILPPGKRIQVSQLRHGVYLYRVNQNNKIFKGKIEIK